MVSTDESRKYIYSRDILCVTRYTNKSVVDGKQYVLSSRNEIHSGSPNLTTPPPQIKHILGI